MVANKKNDIKNENYTKKIINLEKNIKKLENKIEKLNNELKEKNNKLLRSLADFQNYQKRIEKDISNKELEIKNHYILELIDLNELLKKAYEDKKPKYGLKLVINNLEKFFENEGIKYIDCLGKKFDHNLHHAVTIVEKENCDNEEIVEEIKKGFMIDEKLVRPSHVVVAKKRIIN
jgi:molecular chaperone GrpE